MATPIKIARALEHLHATLTARDKRPWTPSVTSSAQRRVLRVVADWLGEPPAR